MKHLIALLSLGILGAGLLLTAAAFVEPTTAPPNGSSLEPLNVGAASQTKAGILQIANNLFASVFKDFLKPQYYLDPAANSGTAGVLNGPLSFNANQIKNVQDPTDPQDAATKAYVQTFAFNPIGTATPGDVASGKTFYSNNKTLQSGTASCTPPAILNPQHGGYTYPGYGDGCTWSWINQPLCYDQASGLQYCKELGYSKVIQLLDGGTVTLVNGQFYSCAVYYTSTLSSCGSHGTPNWYGTATVGGPNHQAVSITCGN